MKRNMGSADRYLRAILAVMVFVLWGTGVIGGALGWILGLIAAVFLATSLVGYCPLYAPFNISTRRKMA